MPAQRQYPQGKYWLLTVAQHLFMPHLPRGCVYVKGQLEEGEVTGFLHWQLLLVFERKVRLSRVQALFEGGIHGELSRSDAADLYVWKEETRVAGTQFELGTKPFKRNSKTDWDEVWNAAKEGRVDDIPASIRVSSYSAIKKIEKDYLKPEAIVRTVNVYVGRTGVGKSRRAWEEAGLDAYPKDPNTKFWDGYRGQDNVVMDEFRGKIDISNILRWTDRYPVSVETKGSGTVFRAKQFWITSNVHPEQWYPDLDQETKDALMRRLNVVVMNEPYYEDLE